MKAARGPQEKMERITIKQIENEQKLYEEVTEENERLMEALQLLAEKSLWCTIEDSASIIINQFKWTISTMLVIIQEAQ